jgi:hypothetical protein
MCWTDRQGYRCSLTALIPRRPTVLCKIVGVYQIGVHNRITGKRTMEQVAVMQNIFYNRKITKTFDLKGSLRGRFAAQIQKVKGEALPETPSQMSEPSNGRSKNGPGMWDDGSRDSRGSAGTDDRKSYDRNAALEAGSGATLLDGDFLEYTMGRPMPMTDRAKAVFQMSILNVGGHCNRVHSNCLKRCLKRCSLSPIKRIHYSCPSLMFWTTRF